MKNNIVLIAIILFGFLVRIVGVDSVPPSLNWDEVSHGYNAYSILTTGKDEWGEILPTIFRAYGDYKLPIYIYTTVPSIAIFELTPLGVRLPSIIAGTVSIFLIYLLTKRLFEKNTDSQNIALLAAFLMAITPWSVFLSRVAVEANLALTFILAGVYFFLSAFNKNYKNLIFSALFFGLSVWTYNSARVFVPILLVGLVVIFRQELQYISQKSKRVGLISGVLLVIFLVPMFVQLMRPIGTARYNELHIVDQGAIAQIEESRNNSNLPGVLNKAINNRLTYFARAAGVQYLSHFSPQFLFLSGGGHYQFSVPERGLIFEVLLIFSLIGLILSLKNIKNKKYQLIIFWLIIAPIASSVTRDSPHVLRSFVLLPVPVILASLGIIWFSNWVTRFDKSLKLNSIIIIFTILILSFSSFMYAYTTDYRNNYSWSWQYGYKEAAEYAKQNYDNYDQILITKKYGEPHEFVLFFNRWNPNDYRNDQNLNRFNQSNWWWVDGFDKYKFVNDWQVKELKLESGANIDCEGKRCLLITSPDNYPNGWSRLDAINFLDGKKAFEIYENK